MKSIEQATREPVTTGPKTDDPNSSINVRLDRKSHIGYMVKSRFPQLTAVPEGHKVYRPRGKTRWDYHSALWFLLPKFF